MIRTVTVEDAGIYECQVCLARLCPSQSTLQLLRTCKRASVVLMLEILNYTLELYD
jgi:hypothetical protein